MAGTRMESSSETPARSALVRTMEVLALETECGRTASWVARQGGSCSSNSNIRIKMVFKS